MIGKTWPTTGTCVEVPELRGELSRAIQYCTSSKTNIHVSVTRFLHFPDSEPTLGTEATLLANAKWQCIVPS
jgi:hypothetical protein